MANPENELCEGERTSKGGRSGKWGPSGSGEGLLKEDEIPPSWRPHRDLDLRDSKPIPPPPPPTPSQVSSKSSCAEAEMVQTWKL